MRLLRISGYLFIVLALATAVVMVLGSRIPGEHTVTRTVVVGASPEKVWGLIADVEGQPRWRSGVKAVQMLGPEDGKVCWREIQTGMALPLCVEASEAPVRRVVRIADGSLPFGGTWTYELEAAGTGGTKVTLTERGTTGPAMWRFAEHYVAGEDRTVRQYLEDLQGAVR